MEHACSVGRAAGYRPRRNPPRLAQLERGTALGSVAAGPVAGNGGCTGLRQVRRVARDARTQTAAGGSVSASWRRTFSKPKRESPIFSAAAATLPPCAASTAST